MARSKRREFLQLAKTYSGRERIAGWLASEKLDGTRCFWDGGLSRGLKTAHVPYASVINPKTGETKAKIKPVATGLWSRYGNPIMAPDDFLDSLPPVPLDGELWAGRGNFQLCRSICAGDEPDPRFDQIRYAIYGTPGIDAVMQDGEIKNSNFHCKVQLDEFAKFIAACCETNCRDFQTLDPNVPFQAELGVLNELLGGDRVFVHQQVKLPDDEEQAKKELERFLSQVLDRGGEGVIIRNPMGIWTPKRVKDLLKYKPYEDAEAVITGFTSGRETDKGSKLLGMIGALITDFNGKRLELAGLTDEERLFLDPAMVSYAESHPGEDMPASFEGKHFKVGDSVSFKYRELSDDEIPKEARYWRRRDVE